MHMKKSGRKYFKHFHITEISIRRIRTRISKIPKCKEVIDL